MPASPVVQVRVPGDVLAKVDETRGTVSRSAWILAAITSRLSPPAAVLSPRRVTGTGLSADMLPAPAAAPSQSRNDDCPHPKARRMKAGTYCGACGHPINK